MTADLESPAIQKSEIWRQAPIALLLLVAAILRVGWVLHLPTDDASIDRLPDQREYLELGRNLAEGNGLSFVDPRFGDAVYAFRSPGYPALVALCHGKVAVIRVFQALLDTASVLGAYLLARRWMDRVGSNFVAILIAFNPFLIYFCGLILSETLFTFLLIWGMALLILPADAWNPPAWGRGFAWLGGAALLALAVLVRPGAVSLPVLLCIISAFVNRPWKMPFDFRIVPPVGTIALAITLLALLPWAWRNHQILGDWIWTTTNSGITMYDGLNPDATGASDQGFVQTMPQLGSMGELGRSQYLSELAWQYAQGHPRRVAELAGLKTARLWSPIPLSSDYGNDRKTVAIAAVYTIPLYLLVVLGLWIGGAPRSIKMYLMAPAIYFTIIHAASVGSLRYRVPSDVPMAIIAGLVVSRTHPRTGE